LTAQSNDDPCTRAAIFDVRSGSSSSDQSKRRGWTPQLRIPVAGSFAPSAPSTRRVSLPGPG
jgi:hypothetical protein